MWKEYNCNCSTHRIRGWLRPGLDFGLRVSRSDLEFDLKMNNKYGCFFIFLTTPPSTTTTSTTWGTLHGKRFFTKSGKDFLRNWREVRMANITNFVLLKFIRQRSSDNYCHAKLRNWNEFFRRRLQGRFPWYPSIIFTWGGGGGWRCLMVTLVSGGGCGRVLNLTCGDCVAEEDDGVVWKEFEIHASLTFRV